MAPYGERSRVASGRWLLWAVPVVLLAREAGAARSVVRSQLLAHAAPVAAPLVTWRLCPGTEQGALIALPAGTGTPAVVLRLLRPLAGSHLTAEPARDLKGGDSLLVRLKAPVGARPGRYDGLLSVRRGPAVARQRAEVEVLPFELMRPSKQYAVSRVPISASAWQAPEDAGAAPLRQLHDLCIGALCLGGPPTDRAAFESTMREAGLHGPVLAPLQASGARRQAPEKATTRTSPDAVVGSSGHPLSSGPTIRWYAYCDGLPATKTMAALKAGGALLACRVGDETDVSGIDLPIFDAGGASGERLLRGGSPAGAAGWWGWDAGGPSPLENRLRCGAWLWKSGLGGALVEIGPDAPAGAGWPLRWEGVRQGILDSRYLTTLFALIRQVKDMDRSSRLPGQAQAAVTAALNWIAAHPSAEAADRMRAMVISWILRLGRMVWS